MTVTIRCQKTCLCKVQWLHKVANSDSYSAIRNAILGNTNRKIPRSLFHWLKMDEGGMYIEQPNSTILNRDVCSQKIEQYFKLFIKK